MVDRKRRVAALSIVKEAADHAIDKPPAQSVIVAC
jgi:hypothetical protein